MRRVLVLVTCSFLFLATWGGTYTLLTTSVPVIPSRGCQCRPITLEDTAQAFVEVRRQDGGYGSGTEGWIGDQVYVLTAAHVCRGEKEMILRREGTGEGDRSAQVLFIDPDRDLAILQPSYPRRGLKVSLLPVDETIRGESAWFTGSGNAVHGWTERGIIAKPTHVHGPWRFVLVTGAGWYGNSGSGIFVSRGDQLRLAGVLVRSVGEDVRAPDGCVHPQVIMGFYREHGLVSD